MSILLIAESHHNTLKKQNFEAATFASHLATTMEQPLFALIIGDCDNADQLGNYGVEKIVTLSENPAAFDVKVYTQIIQEVIQKENTTTVVSSHNSNSKSFLPYLSIKWQADYLPTINTLPETVSPLTVGRTVYSGKAEATIKSDADRKVISISPNSIPIQEKQVSATTETLTASSVASALQVTVQERATASIPLPEAERVVSGGRGVGGPENWNVVLDLADVLEAATACSRPVADMGWRPHYEHVGQTGVAIKPNLYIAMGISGAIQHLGGVNQSKVIVVINKDPEAPFFKAATYGVVGDLFDVAPRLTEEVKKFKASH